MSSAKFKVSARITVLTTYIYNFGVVWNIFTFSVFFC